MAVRYELAFDEGSGTSIAEASGGNAATLQAGGSWVSGNTGNAVVSASSAAPAAIADTSALGTATWTGITIMAWVKHNTNTGDDIMAGFTTSGHAADVFGIGTAATTNIYGWVNTNVAGSQTSNYTHGWTTGTWHHVALAWSSVGGSIRLFTDGVQRVTVARTGATVAANMAVVEIGNVYWNGATTGMAIDDFRIYDTELTAGQISTASAAPVGGGGALPAPYVVLTPTPRFVTRSR